jgi:hypothetical protein
MSSAVVGSGRNAAMTNPIDTGFSSGNWRISDTPDVKESETFYPTASISTFNSDVSGHNWARMPIYLVNPVHYVQYLNQGTSSQAPQPFWIERGCERAIDMAVRKKGGIALDG